MRRKVKVIFLAALAAVCMLFCSCGVVDGITNRIEGWMCSHTNTQTVAAKAATCTEDGHTSYKVCNDCGKELEEKVVYPALGHKYEITVGVQATCTTSGATSGEKCSVCGDVKVEQEKIPAKGHSLVDVEGKDPTCYEDGLESGRRCVNCDFFASGQTVIPHLEHNYVNGVCSNCGADHIHVEEVIPAVEGNCLSKGWSAGLTCSNCGDILIEPKETELGSHNIVNDVCMICGEVFHTHTEAILPEVSPTCTTDGLTQGLECSECHEVLIPQTVIAASHTFEDYGFLNTKNRCVVCSETYVKDGCLDYNYNGTIVLGVGKLSENTTLRIPSCVEEIQWEAFKGNRNISRVIFEGDITIWYSAFHNCSNLKLVEFYGDVLLQGRSDDGLSGTASQFAGCASGCKFVFYSDVVVGAWTSVFGTKPVDYIIYCDSPDAGLRSAIDLVGASWYVLDQYS